MDADEIDASLVCDDGLDNDGDSLTDFPADPGCTDVFDAEEASACADGLDNDGDGETDFPADPGCANAIDDSERSLSLVCDDGIDNDADGRTDFDPATFASPGDETTLPAGSGDPVCMSPSFTRETSQCQNGIHDDGDGKMDYDAGLSFNGVADPAGPDPQCLSVPWRLNEGNSAKKCGLGAELALLLPLLIVWRGRRRSR